ncbi:MAG: ChpI protein [Gammaproteobacteria bacterium]|nr:ChpI protein [Gammaproteobacteria bacterium]
MKTAISIPDKLFATGEDLARRLEISRSELYRRALNCYLKEQGAQVVTAALDSVYGDIESSALDPLIAHLQGVSVVPTDGDW